MPKGRPITVNIKDMSAQRLREYRRAASRKYYKKQRAERRLPRDFGDNRECLECKEIKPRTHEFFEQRYGDFRGECIPCRNKKQKAARIKRAFNGTLAEYEEIMRDAQCAICGAAEKLVLDHCHDKGHVRGVLCNHCNSMLGFARDDQHTLQCAIKYLDERRNGLP